MQNFAISAKGMTASLVVWLTAGFIWSDLSRLTMLLLSSIIMPSLLFIMGFAWVLNVPRLGLHKEPAL